MKNRHFINTVYFVSYGPKKDADREWKRFDDAESANEFFQMKQRDFHGVGGPMEIHQHCPRNSQGPNGSEEESEI